MQTSPSYVPVRSSGWPRPRVPRWVYLAGAGVVIIAVLLALVHKPSQAERASDLRGLLTEVTADIESCAGGVSESLQALHEVQSGADATTADIAQGIGVAQYGATNCGPAENEQIDDLESYQVPESLDGYKLESAITGLVNWAAPDAENVQNDVANVLSAKTAAARSRAQAQLAAALTVLDRQGSAIDGTLNHAIRSLGVTQHGPVLPGASSG
jgi:hypothetical protein